MDLESRLQRIEDKLDQVIELRANLCDQERRIEQFEARLGPLERWYWKVLGASGLVGILITGWKALQ